MCSEVLNGIKIIKLYAWEPPMERTIENIRHNELKFLQKFGFARAVVDTFNTASPFLVYHSVNLVEKNPQPCWS